MSIPNREFGVTLLGYIKNDVVFVLVQVFTTTIHQGIEQCAPLYSY